MSDIDGGAPAPAEVTSAPAAEPVAEAPEAIHEAEPTPRGAIDRAFASLEEAEPTQAAEPTDGARRGPDGRFLPKEGEPAQIEGQPVTAEAVKPEDVKPLTNFAEPPTRFSPDAKTAWKDAPEPVRAEITRAVKELEGGLEKYRGDASAFADVKEFAELARSQGTSLKAALSNYVGMEQMLRKDPEQGLAQIAKNLGLPLRDIAAKIAGQPADRVASEQDATIRELRQELAGLKQEIGGVTSSISQQRTSAVMSEITQFASKPEFSRFEELAGDIKIFLDSGRVDKAQPIEKALSEAYTLAERLNPAPVQAAVTPAPLAPAPIDQKPQTPKGQKSLSGAPNSGSNPAHRLPPSTARESIDRAFATMEIG